MGLLLFLLLPLITRADAPVTASQFFSSARDRTVLIISPHPDDDIFGCGGALAMMAGRGTRVVTVYLTSGEVGTYDEAMTKRRLRRIRQSEAAAAYRALGYPDARLIWLDYPDSELDYADRRKLKIRLMRIIREVRPDILFGLDAGATHVRYHYHDHRTAAEVTTDALTGASLRLLHPEAGGPHRVRDSFFFYSVEPNASIDLTQVLPLKLRSLQQHRSQFPPYNTHYQAGTELPPDDTIRRQVVFLTGALERERFRHRGPTKIIDDPVTAAAPPPAP